MNLNVFDYFGFAAHDHHPVHGQRIQVVNDRVDRYGGNFFDAAHQLIGEEFTVHNGSHDKNSIDFTFQNRSHSTYFLGNLVSHCIHDKGCLFITFVNHGQHLVQ